MNKSILIVMPLITLLAGCAGLQGPLTDAALGAGGGLLGDKLGGGNPYAIAGGAAGGVLLGEGLRAWKKHDEKEAYTTGYVRGRGDSVQQNYWLLQDAQKNPPPAK
jgi:hypothetical protein